MVGEGNEGEDGERGVEEITWGEYPARSGGKKRESLGFGEMMSWAFRKRTVVAPYRKLTIYMYKKNNKMIDN